MTENATPDVPEVATVTAVQPRGPEHETWVNIKGATVLLGFKHDQYTRKLVTTGKLVAEKVQDGHVVKWLIDPTSIKAYRATARTRTSMRRWILRFDIEHEDAVREALDDIGLEYTLELSYVPKKDEDEAPEAA